MTCCCTICPTKCYVRGGLYYAVCHAAAPFTVVGTVGGGSVARTACGRNLSSPDRHTHTHTHTGVTGGTLSKFGLILLCVCVCWSGEILQKLYRESLLCKILFTFLILKKNYFQLKFFVVLAIFNISFCKKLWEKKGLLMMLDDIYLSLPLPLPLPVTLNCGETTNENCTYFDSSGITAGSCSASVCPCADNICQVGEGRNLERERKKNAQKMRGDMRKNAGGNAQKVGEMRKNAQLCSNLDQKMQCSKKKPLRISAAASAHFFVLFRNGQVTLALFFFLPYPPHMTPFFFL